MTIVLQVFLASLLSAPMQLVQLWDAVATARVETRVKAMREAGEPTTMAELAKMYPDPPKGQNAARFFNAAFKLMKKVQEQDPGDDLPIVGAGELPAVDQRFPPQMLKALEAYVDLNTEVLALLHRGAALEHCKFDIKFEDGPGMLLPHLSSMRQGARLLTLEAIVRTEGGKADAAAESLVAGLRLGHALRAEPVLITALVRIACGTIGVGQVQRWVSRSTPSPRALEKVQDALRAEADRKILEKVFLAERCFGMDIYQNYVLNPKNKDLAGLIGAQPGPEALAMRLVPRAYFRMDMAHYIDLMTQYVEASRKPYPESFRAGARVGRDMEQQIPRHYIICRMLIPALGRVFAQGQLHVARLDCARVGLAALRYRAKHGGLPDKLEALAPDLIAALPPDPYSGKPLFYRKAADGFVIYAIGDNGKDDGGDIERAGGEQPDVGFRVRLPKPEF